MVPTHVRMCFTVGPDRARMNISTSPSKAELARPPPWSGSSRRGRGSPSDQFSACRLASSRYSALAKIAISTRRLAS